MELKLFNIKITSMLEETLITRDEKEIASIKTELRRWMVSNEKNNSQLFPYIKELVNEYNKKK